jgi:hypothetical protein
MKQHTTDKLATNTLHLLLKSHRQRPPVLGLPLPMRRVTLPATCRIPLPGLLRLSIKLNIKPSIKPSTKPNTKLKIPRLGLRKTLKAPPTRLPTRVSMILLLPTQEKIIGLKITQKKDGMKTLITRTSRRIFLLGCLSD